MKLWLVVQWGNKDEGANGNDTQCIVRANDMTQAITEAQDYLSAYEWKNGIADMICLLGEDVCIDVLQLSKPGLVIRPWVDAIFGSVAYETWYRHPANDIWLSKKEMYGDI